MSRGFGIPAMDDADLVVRVAKEVEALNYTTFWTNDTPVADGIEVARWVLEATERIRVGVGVVALDRRPPTAIADAIRTLDSDRLLLGVGAGFSTSPLRTAKEGIAELRQLAPEFKLSLAAMGPKMCRLAGEIADAVLLNWMTPEKVAWSKAEVAVGETSKGPAATEIGCYVRVAFDEGAAQRLTEEAARYAQMPHYKRHFDAMSVEAGEVGLAGDASIIARGLVAYDRETDETVVRALPSAYAEEPLIRIARVGMSKD